MFVFEDEHESARRVNRTTGNRFTRLSGFSDKPVGESQNTDHGVTGERHAVNDSFDMYNSKLSYGRQREGMSSGLRVGTGALRQAFGCLARSAATLRSALS